MKQRLDVILLEAGHAGSRERARALIMANKVLVNGVPVTKPGAAIDASSRITLRGEDIPFVSRGGLKLASAIKGFNITVKDRIGMDIGASTGGFTDCLLQWGAQKVYAIDVGYGQLAWALRKDDRVIPLERTNFRYLERDQIPDMIDIAVIDVSFISLTKIIPKVIEFLSPLGEIVALIKPQFEIGKGAVGKGGIVRDEGKREGVIKEMKTFIHKCGMGLKGICESPIKGQKGNIEYLMYCSFS